MQKRNKKPAKFKPTPVGIPVFQYVSVCHKAKATKVPLVMPQGRRIAEFGKTPDPEGQATGRGKFRCGECGKPCKCTRSKTEKSTPEGQ